MKKAQNRRATGMTGVCPHCGGKLPGGPDGKGRQRYALRRRRGLWQGGFGWGGAWGEAWEGGGLCGAVAGGAGAVSCAGFGVQGRRRRDGTSAEGGARNAEFKGSAGRRGDGTGAERGVG